MEWIRNQPAESDAWRRTCGVCSDADEQGRLGRMIVATVLGVDTSEAQAQRVLGSRVHWDPRSNDLRWRGYREGSRSRDRQALGASERR